MPGMMCELGSGEEEDIFCLNMKKYTEIEVLF